MEHIGSVVSTDIKLGIDAEFLETLYEFRKDSELDIYYNTDTKLFEYTVKEVVYDIKGMSSTVNYQWLKSMASCFIDIRWYLHKHHISMFHRNQVTD